MVAVAAVCAGAVAPASAAGASDGWEGHILQINLENDAIARSDRHYTQGAHFTYLTRDDWMPGWMRRCSDHLPTFGATVEARKLGFSLGQEIYTPDDLRATNVVVDDRPYAGWLFGSVLLERRGVQSGALPFKETFRIDAGIIGPESQAEQLQKRWHGEDPQGWHNQLDTEFGLALRYNRRFQFAVQTDGGNWRAEATPRLDASLGNVAIDLGCGFEVRGGWRVPDEFAVPRGKPNRTRFGAYLFGAVNCRWVIRNIFLDGNSFQDSHRVDKEPLVAEMRGGLTIIFKRVEFSGAYVKRTREFELQEVRDSYGSASITMKF
jgi:hypothetical protein